MAVSVGAGRTLKCTCTVRNMEGPSEPLEARTAIDSVKKYGYEVWMDAVVSLAALFHRGIVSCFCQQNTVTGPGTADRFEEKGFVTPDQFVAAGDMLTAKCRTWTW